MSSFELDAEIRDKDVVRDGVQTTLVCYVNARSICICNSAQGKHAESDLIDLLNHAQGGNSPESMVMNECASKNRVAGVSYIDIFITRSPCLDCTNKLVNYATKYCNGQKKLRLFCATIYKGEGCTESINNINRLQSMANVDVWRWDVVAMAKAKDSSSLSILHVMFGVSQLEFGSNYNKTDWMSRLGTVNLQLLGYLPHNDPSNFYVTP